jgi:hypothetical protein
MIGRPALFAAKIRAGKIIIQGPLDICIQTAAGKQRQKAQQQYGLFHNSFSVDWT